MHENEISERIIGCAIEVHKALGPGLLESAYEECLAAEMETQGLHYGTPETSPAGLQAREARLWLSCGFSGRRKSGGRPQST